MKVLIISHMYPSNFNSMSGIFVHDQAAALMKNGCEIRVISPVPWAPFPLNKLSKKWEGYNRVPKKDVSGPIIVYYPRYIEFPKGILLHKSGNFMAMGIDKVVNEIYKEFKFDIIHSNVALPDGYSGMIVNRKFKVPHVVTIHGQDFQNTIKKNERCKRAVINVLNNADSIITVSNKLRGMIPEKKLNDKVVVINNGIDESFIKNDYCENIKSKASDKIRILSVSNLKETKGIQINLEAISYLINKYDNIQYDIIGEGQFEGELRNLVQKFNLDKIVTFLGKKNHDEVIKKMSDYDIFSLPSYNEGFGIVYVEAMSQGVPVIGVKGEGIEDVIKDGYNGFLVEPKDVNSLVNVLDLLIGDNEKRKLMGLNGKSTVIKDFTWDTNAKKVKKLYEYLVSNEKLNNNI